MSTTADQVAALDAQGIPTTRIAAQLGITQSRVEWILETGLARAGRGDLVTVLRRAYLSPSWETRGGQCATQLGQVAS